ncbi:MAG: hypothetical protein D6806_10910, partial [Deltaproteobacteria bacterium]
MLVKRIKCTNCGAPLDVAPRAVTILCEYCGSYLGVHSGEIWDLAGRAWEGAGKGEGLEHVFPSTEAQARMVELGQELSEAKERGDRTAFRALALEQASLQLMEQAERDPESRPRSKAELIERARQAVAMQEILAFDSEVARAQEDLLAAGQRLLSAGDHLAAARELLEACRRFYRLLYR